MKRIIAAALAALAVCTMALSTAVAANAATQATFAARSCDWGMHAYVDIESKGKQKLQITGTNKVTDTRTFPATKEVRRNWLNSPTASSKSSYAWTDSSSWQNASTNCSW